jgi:hypothetical protein
LRSVGEIAFEREIVMKAWLRTESGWEETSKVIEGFEAGEDAEWHAYMNARNMTIKAQVGESDVEYAVLWERGEDSQFAHKYMIELWLGGKGQDLFVFDRLPDALAIWRDICGVVTAGAVELVQDQLRELEKLAKKLL